MDTRGAMAPTNFEKYAFGTHDGTHEILTLSNITYIFHWNFAYNLGDDILGMNCKPSRIPKMLA